MDGGLPAVLMYGPLRCKRTHGALVALVLFDAWKMLGGCWDNYSYRLNNNEQHAVDRLTCMLERVCAGMAGRHETESRVWVPALTHPVIRLMQQQS